MCPGSSQHSSKKQHAESESHCFEGIGVLPFHVSFFDSGKNGSFKNHPRPAIYWDQYKRLAGDVPTEDPNKTQKLYCRSQYYSKCVTPVRELELRSGLPFGVSDPEDDRHAQELGITVELCEGRSRPADKA